MENYQYHARTAGIQNFCPCIIEYMIYTLRGNSEFSVFNCPVYLILLCGFRSGTRASVSSRRYLCEDSLQVLLNLHRVLRVLFDALGVQKLVLNSSGLITAQSGRYSALNVQSTNNMRSRTTSANLHFSLWMASTSLQVMQVSNIHGHCN